MSEASQEEEQDREENEVSGDQDDDCRVHQNSTGAENPLPSFAVFLTTVGRFMKQKRQHR